MTTLERNIAALASGILALTMIFPSGDVVAKGASGGGGHTSAGHASATGGARAAAAAGAARSAAVGAAARSAAASRATAAVAARTGSVAAQASNGGRGFHIGGGEKGPPGGGGHGFNGYARIPQGPAAYSSHPTSSGGYYPYWYYYGGHGTYHHYNQKNPDVQAAMLANTENHSAVSPACVIFKMSAQRWMDGISTDDFNARFEKVTQSESFKTGKADPEADLTDRRIAAAGFDCMT